VPVTYASGWRRDAAEAVAHVASRGVARLECSRLPSDLPGAFVSAWSRFARCSCSATVLGRASASSCMATWVTCSPASPTTSRSVRQVRG
jgi:hypothetical protein